MGSLNKRGIVFTFIAASLLSIIILIFLFNLSNRAQGNIQETNIKIETINNFVKSLSNDYLKTALRTSSNQVILSFLDREDKTDNFIDISNFKDSIMMGYYTPDVEADKLKLMFQEDLNFTLPSALEEIKEFGDGIGVNFSYKFNSNSIVITQTETWNLDVKFIVSYEVNDLKRNVKWKIDNKEINAKLDIQNYRDPLYIVKENVNNTINKTTITNWNLDNFKEFVKAEHFRENPSAPSFLDRLEGTTDANPNGIESLLDPNYYANPSVFSNVDYQYWTNTHGGCSVDGMDNSFRLETSHLLYYTQNGACELP